MGAVVSTLDKTDDGVGHDRVSISRVSPRTMGLPKNKTVYKRCLFSLKYEPNVDKRKKGKYWDENHSPSFCHSFFKYNDKDFFQILISVLVLFLT